MASSESVSVSSATRSAFSNRASHWSKSAQFRMVSYTTLRCWAASATGLALWSANRSPLSPGMATAGVAAGLASCSARARPLKPYFS